MPVTTDSANNFQNLTTVLKKIPANSWKTIVEKEPEWYNMEPFLQRYGFGKLATLMVACGLNDFQLKGRAEFSYWPKIKALLESRVVTSIGDLHNVLREFYSNERLSTMKCARIDTFITSLLVRDTFSSTP